MNLAEQFFAKYRRFFRIFPAIYNIVGQAVRLNLTVLEHRLKFSLTNLQKPYVTE